MKNEVTARPVRRLISDLGFMISNENIDSNTIVSALSEMTHRLSEFRSSDYGSDLFYLLGLLELKSGSSIDAVKDRWSVAAGKILESKGLSLHKRAIDASGDFLDRIIIVGAGKCGTTSLFDALSRNHRILPSLKKEVDCLGYELFDMGLYQMHFADAYYSIPGQFRTLESSPRYFQSERVRLRIKELPQKTRLVIMLRDPVEKVFSHHIHDLKVGALNFKPSELSSLIMTDLDTCAMLDESHLYNAGGIIPASVYWLHVEKWINQFGNDAVFVYFLEAAEDRTQMTRLADFLSVDNATVALSHLNPGLSRADTNFDISARAKELLRTFFAPHNAKIRDLVEVPESVRWC